MIQRKQTLFLLAVFIIAIIMIFIPFQVLLTSGESWNIALIAGNSWIILNSNMYYPNILNLLIIVLSIFTIFKYKNRPLQYKLSNVIALLNIFMVGLFFLLPYTHANPGESIKYAFGSFLPILSMGFAFLAAHFIKKDEQLVRSADRIR
jgi:hypothetical protein